MSDRFTRISIYVPLSKQPKRPFERLKKLAAKRDRTMNYLVIEAILDYVKREERKEARKSTEK